MGVLDAPALSVGQGRWPTGSYLQPEGASGSQLLVADRLYFTPLWVPEARTTASLDIELTVSGVGGAPTLRLGVYLADTSGRPGTKLVDAGTVDASVAAGLLTKAVTQAVGRGLVWMACVAQGATTTQPTVRAIQGYNRWTSPTSLIAGAARAGYHQNSVTGALPSSATPVLTVSTNLPHVLMKAA